MLAIVLDPFATLSIAIDKTLRRTVLLYSIILPCRRLSCHCQLEGDIVIDVPPESQVHRQVVRKAAGSKLVALDPLIQLYYVEV